MLRFLKQSVAGILVGILCIQIPFGALAQDGGETSEPVQTREYGFDDPRLKQQEIPLARETTSEFEALSVEIDPTNLEKSKESLQRFVDEFTEFAEGGFEEPKELIKRTSKYAYKRQLFSAINTIYRYMLVAKGIVTSSEGIPDFLYGADRFFRHNLETKEKLTRAVVTSFMISHAIEMSVFPASVADMNLTGSIVGFVIQIPGLDPLCWTTAWLLVRLEPLRNGMYKLNLFVVKRFPGPLFNALGAELALRFMYEKSRGELFRELRNPYEIETVRRNFDANKNEIDFSFKTSDGKKYMGMVFKTEPKQMLRLKSVWFHPEHLRSVSNQQINAELKPFGGRINNLMKQYIKAIQSGDAGVEQIVQNDPSKKSFLRTTEADGTQSILLNLHDQVMKPLSQNKSYFDWYFYSSQHAAIKHLKNVDSALVEKAQGEFLELLRKQMREHSFRDDVFKMEKFIEHALTRVTATMNPETRTHFLGQVFRNGDVFLFSHEHAYALQDDLRRSNNDDSKATEVEFKKIVALTQATFFNQLMGIKNVASYYHAAKALLSKFTLPDETSVRDMANERFQNTEPSDALRRGYKFAIAFNKPHNSKHIDDNRMVEVDNWLSTQKSIPKYDYVLPAVEQIKGKSIAELMPMLEKIPVAYIGVEGERYVAAVNQIDAELKRLRANAKQSAQAQHQYDQTIRSLGKIANKSMGTSVFDQPK
ncbi:MAG: hypothetical protein IT286_03815, partial [Proteobacteria bacterium]|nr:hypothetical protein [Pseudomonadota bacterium]